MALLGSVKTDLYRFFAIAFDAAPGVTYMTQLADAVAANMSVQQIVEVFTTKPEFTSTYPTFLTNGDFAVKLVNNVVGGSASAAAKAEAVADIEAALSAGLSRGKVVYNVFNNLAKLTGDAKWGGTAALLANQVAYAQYYTEVLLGDTTNLATLRAVIAGVTPTTDITPAAINAVLNPPPVVVQPSYALSANAASADEGTSVLFTLTTANVAAGSTFTYTLGGVNASDVVGGSLTGVATVGSDGKAVIQVNLAADGVTDGAKNLTVSVAGQTASVTLNDTSTTPVVVVPTFALTAADSVTEGAVSTFTLQTTGLAAGSQVGYKITGAGSAAAQTTTGVFTVDSAGRAAVAVVPAANSTVGDTGSLTLELLNGQTAAKTVTVTDGTSKATGVASIAAANAAGSGIVTINVEGTAAQAITLSTDQVTATNGFVINALSAPVTVTSGAGNDRITLVGAAGNTISTGAGNDTVILSTVGNTTIDVGAGNDAVTGTSGNESITVGSGDLGAGDTFNLGAGTDTVTISGDGNVVTAANLQGVENLVLNGTKVTFASAAALATVKNISGSSTTSELTVTVANGDTVDLTGIALTTIKQITLAKGAAGASTVTVKADAADLAALGAVLQDNTLGGGALTVNLQTDVAGYKALAAADTGINGTKTVTDTANAIIADKASLTGATIVVSGTVSASDVQSLPVGSTRTVGLSVNELLVAAQYPDQKAALTAAGTKIKVVGDATVAQAQTLIANYSVQIQAYTGADTGITVSDSAANLVAGLAGGVPAEVSGYKIAAGGAAIAIGTAGLTNLAAQAANGKILSGTFSVKGTVAEVVANVANNVVTKAASVSLNAGQKATAVADALALKGLGSKLSGGYAFELDSQALQTAGDNGLSALAGAATAKVTTNTVVIDVSKLGIYQASNAAVKVDVLEDNPANLVAGGSTKLAAATSSIKVVGGVTVAQASALQSAITALIATGGSAAADGATTVNAYRLSDTKAAVVGASNAVLGAATKVTVTGAMTLAEAQNLYAAATASGTDALATAGLSYSVSDTAASLAAGLTGASAATVVAVLTQATSVTANTAATVAQGATLAAAVPTIAFDVADSVANILGSDAIVDVGGATLAEMTKLSVNSGSMTIAQVAALKAAAAAKFDNVYSITDTSAAIVDTADVRAATSVTVSDAAAVSDLADIKALNAARTTAGKSTVSYTLADSYANVVAGWAGNSAEIKAATSIKMTAAFSGGSAIDGNALADLTDKFGSTTPYALEVTDTSANILGAGVLAGVMQDAKITKIIVSDALSVADAKLVAQKAGTASSKTQYDLQGSLASLTAAADAATVLAARNLTATGAILVTEANTLEGLTGASGTVSYSVSDSYANLIANPAVTDKATTVAVSDLATLTVAQYANLMSVANATGANSLAAMTVTDTAAAVSAASAAVLDSASNVTLTDVGYITLNAAQAKGLFAAGNYKLALAPGVPLGGAAPSASVKVQDTTANLIALKNGVDADSTGVLGSAQSVKFEATDIANLSVANATTLASIGAKLSASFNLSDNAGAVAGSAQLGTAKAVTVTGTATAQQANAVLNGKAATAASTVNVVDTAAKLQSDITAANLAKVTSITADANTGTAAVDGILASEVAYLLANKGSVPLTANIADSAASIKAAAAATLAAAGTVTVTGAAATVSEAVAITALSNRAGTFAVTDSAVAVAANLTAAASAGGNVTLNSAPMVDQYSAIKSALGAKLVAGSTVTDTAAKIADFLLAGNTADAYALSGSTAVSVAQAAKILATAGLGGTTTLQLSGNQADLMTAAAGQAKYTVTGGAIELWQAKELDAKFTSAKTSFAIATTADRFLAAYDTDASTAGQQADAAQKTALQNATSLTVDGVSVTLGSKNANLPAGNVDKILGSVAELNALSSSLKAAAKYIVVDTVANITSAANTAVLNGSAGYVVADTAANVAAASAATLATASGALAIQTTDQATVAQAAAIVAATNLLAANVRFELTDTAANLTAGVATVNKAAKVVVSDAATAVQADAIVGAGGGGATATFSVLDTGTAIAGMTNENKAVNVTADADLNTAGLQGITMVSAGTILTNKGSGTVTFNVADTVGSVAAAAANAAKAGTVTVTGTATVTEGKTVAGLANLTGGYQVSGISADLTDATKITMADLAKASKVTATDAATVAQANALLAVAAIAKDATSGKPLLSIADTAKVMAGANAATLDSIHTANTVTINSYVAALTAAEATNLATVDAASTKLSSASTSVKVSDSAANILSANNASALGKVGGITVTDTSISVATLNAVKALKDAGTAGAHGLGYTYNLSDGVIALVAAGPATFNGATKLTVTGTVPLADAQTTFGMFSAAGALTAANLSFEKITGTYTQLTTATLTGAAGAVTPLSKSAAVSLTAAIDLTQAADAAFMAKLAGGYLLADTAASVLAGVMNDGQKALLGGATTVSLSDTASVSQAQVIAGQLSNEAALPLKDTAAKLKAASAASTVAAAASVVVAGSAGNDAISKTATTAKVTYEFAAGDMLGVASSANGTTTFAAGVDVLSLKTGDAISLVGLGGLTLDAGGALTAGEYRLTRGVYAADGSFVALSSGNDLMIEIETAANSVAGAADEVIILVGTTTVTAVGTAGNVTGFTGG